MDYDTRYRLARFTTNLRKLALVVLLLSCATALASKVFGLSQDFLSSSVFGLIMAAMFEGIGWNVHRIMKKQGVNPIDGSLL